MRAYYQLRKMEKGAMVRILLLVAILLAQALPAVAVGPDEGPVSDLLSGPNQPAQIDVPVLSVGASASPSYLSAGGLVTYRVTGVNSGDNVGSNFQVAFASTTR
jgi:hypothetical protein